MHILWGVWLQYSISHASLKSCFFRLRIPWIMWAMQAIVSVCYRKASGQIFHADTFSEVLVGVLAWPRPRHSDHFWLLDPDPTGLLLKPFWQELHVRDLRNSTQTELMSSKSLEHPVDLTPPQPYTYVIRIYDYLICISFPRWSYVIHRKTPAQKTERKVQKSGCR